MNQPSLNEYFTLTNDLLFKIIFNGYSGERDSLTGKISRIFVSPETIEAEKSISLAMIVNDSCLIGMQIVSAYHSVKIRIKALTLDLLKLQARERPGQPLHNCKVITFVQAPLPKSELQALRSLRWSDLEPDTLLDNLIELETIPLPIQESFQLPMSVKDQYRWFWKEARPHFQTPAVRQLLQINPNLQRMQLILDYLSDQPVVRELVKKRYLRMQEIILGDEKAAMRA